MAGALRFIFSILILLQFQQSWGYEDCFELTQKCHEKAKDLQDCFATKGKDACSSLKSSCQSQCDITAKKTNCRQRFIYSLQDFGDDPRGFCKVPRQDSLETAEGLQQKLERNRDKIIDPQVTPQNARTGREVGSELPPMEEFAKPPTLKGNAYVGGELKPSPVDYHEIFLKKNGGSNSPSNAKSPDQVSGSGQGQGQGQQGQGGAGGGAGGGGDGGGGGASTASNGGSDSSSSSSRGSESTKNSPSNSTSNGGQPFSPTIGSNGNLTPSTYDGKTDGSGKDNANAGGSSSSSGGGSRLGGFGGSFPGFNPNNFKSNTSTPALTGNFNPQFHGGGAGAGAAGTTKIASLGKGPSFSRSGSSGKKKGRKVDSFDRILSMFNARRPSSPTHRSPAAANSMSEYCSAGIDIGQHTILSNAEQFFNKQNLEENGELTEEIIPSKQPASCRQKH